MCQVEIEALVGGTGFEPIFFGSEPNVLPLDEPPVARETGFEPVTDAGSKPAAQPVELLAQRDVDAVTRAAFFAAGIGGAGGSRTLAKRIWSSPGISCSTPKESEMSDAREDRMEWCHGLESHQ